MALLETKTNKDITTQDPPELKERTWTPLDFGFYSSIDRKDVFYKDGYELRAMPSNMWLLRRRKKIGSKVEVLVKAYYYILETDYIFAEFLFLTRLNGTR